MTKDTTWGKFCLSDIFYIKKGKRLTKSNQTAGDTPFIGATALKNGRTAFIGQPAIHKGNTISLTYNGSVGEAFYQSEDFWASDDVNVLYPKGFELNESIALFICTVLRHEKQMWSYARKWNLDQMMKTVIMLPSTQDGSVDCDYMEQYIENLNHDVESIPDYFLDEGYEKACWYLDNVSQELFEQTYASRKAKQRAIDERAWEIFKIGDIVQDIHNGKSYNAGELVVSDTDDYVSYITRTDNNNGVSLYVQAQDYEGLEKAGALTIGDTTATIFYQSHDFITGPHIIVLRAPWLNVYTAIFLIALLNMQKYRYPVFGRAFTKDLIAETEIPLPVNEIEEPDFEFMEEYIKGCAFSCNIE